MLKTTERLKIVEVQPRIEARLKDLASSVPFLSIQSMHGEQEAHGVCLDIVVETEFDGSSWRWVVECLGTGQPREVRHALLRLRTMVAGDAGKHVYGLVAAPFFSSESRQLCVVSGVGYVDLAGNARLSFGRVFIELRAAGNPFLERRSLRSLFSPKAGRVLKGLLALPLRAWKVQELATSSGVSLGQVSNVRKLLLEREWARVEPAGLYVHRPLDLLEAWKTAYELISPSRESWYTLLDGEALEDAARTAFAEAGGGAHAVYASYSAARWYAPYARHATAFFYADAAGKDILARLLGLRPVERGGNVVLFEPREDDVLANRVEATPGIWCSDPVTTWLDLNTAGDRGAEAAEVLLKQVLLPGWKERQE